MQERREKKEGTRKGKGKGRGRYWGRDTGERHRRRNIRKAEENDRDEQTEGKRQR